MKFANGRWSVKVVSYEGKGQRYQVREHGYMRAETPHIEIVREVLGDTVFAGLEEVTT